MIELYLNGLAVEMFDLPALSLTRQINNFGELKDRQATYTNTFNIPKTNKNLKIFQGLGIVGNQSTAPYTTFDAILKIDTQTVVSNGKAFVKGYNGHYSVNIVDDNIHLFDKLGDKKLSDLDLSALTHDLTTTNFTGSFGNTDGYIYALADFGNFNVSEIVINNQLPSLFVKWIWNKIFEEAGYTCNFIPENDLLITPKRGYDTIEDVGQASEVTASASSSAQGGLSPGYYETSETLSFEPSQTVGQIVLNEDGVTAMANGIYFYDLNVGDEDSFNLVSVFVNVKVNTATIATHEMGSIFGQLQLQVGDIVTFEVVTTLLLDEYYPYAFANLTTNMTFYTVVGGSGLQVNFGTFIGEIKQTDFIKDIMQHYCLLSQKTKDVNNIEFIKAKDLLTDKANAVDLSCVFLNEDYSTDYAQKNIFKYQYREQDGVPFADGVLAISNDTLKPERVVLTRPYNAPETCNYTYKNELLCYVPFWEATRDNDGVISGWKVIKGKNYFAKLKYVNHSIDYKTQNGDLDFYTGDIPRLSFQGLGYQSILDENYKEVQQMLNHSKTINVKIKMNIFDFNQFNLFNLVFSKELGGYFYVNSLKWTNGKNEVDAELISVPMTEVNNTVAKIWHKK